MSHELTVDSAAMLLNAQNEVIRSGV